MADFSVEDGKLREDLIAFGESVGKINVKTRPILIKKLNHLRARQLAAERPSSPGRRKSTAHKTIPNRAAPSSNSDEDVAITDDTSSTKEISTAGNVRNRNLRRRTIEIGLLEDRNDTRPTKLVSMKSGRRSMGVTTTTNSPFQAGSLLKQMASSPDGQVNSKPAGDLHVTPIRKTNLPASGYLCNEDDLSFSDDEYTFREMASFGINTTQSLEHSRNGLLANQGNLFSSSSASSERATEKKVSGTSCFRHIREAISYCHILLSVRWHTISQLMFGCMALFFMAVILLYIFAISSNVQSTNFESLKLCLTDMSCVEEDMMDVKEIITDIAEVLNKRAGNFECGQSETRYMSLDNLRNALKQQYLMKNENFDEAVKFVSQYPLIGIKLLDSQHKDTNDVSKIGYLVSINADKSLWCRITTAFVRLFNYIIFTVAGIVIGISSIYGIIWWKKSAAKQSQEINQLIDNIIVLLKNHASACQFKAGLLPYVAIPHVRDALIPLCDRGRKQKIWSTAAQMIRTHESRVREEVKTIDGEECCVWRWVDTLPRLQDDTPFTVSRTQKAADSPTIKTRSSCLRICNMIDTAESYCESDIIEEVLDRCGLHSGILHIGISTSSPDGVFVKFVSESAATQACRLLHGWTYNGKLTSVKEIGAFMYRALFPESASAMVPLRSSSNKRLSQSFSSMPSRVKNELTPA